MVKVSWKKHVLKFRFEAGTSRGVLHSKPSYFIIIQEEGSKTGIGECSLLPQLSIDERPDFENKLNYVCNSVEWDQIRTLDMLKLSLDTFLGNKWPSMKMGFETAYLDYFNGGGRVVFQNDFLKGKGIPINGLIWMGEKDIMLQQVKQKIESGFSCIKIKIGAIDFKTELEILQYIRNRFSEKDIMLRVDANGAFTPENVLAKLGQLEKFKIHSIEQPIKNGQWEKMAELCKISPIPIGLDEELIGNFTFSDKKILLQSIDPQYIILKPSLLGGFNSTKDWIELAESMGIGWWITSALESNIGLNAICQFTFGYNTAMEQGLGTGQLFTNNINSPLEVKKGHIFHNRHRRWDLSALNIDGIQ